jgi:hypothetical protein
MRRQVTRHPDLALSGLRIQAAGRAFRQVDRVSELTRVILIAALPRTEIYLLAFDGEGDRGVGGNVSSANRILVKLSSGRRGWRSRRRSGTRGRTTTGKHAAQ